jgi:hypothetical protein
MFVSRKLVFRKPFSKLSCVCLPLEKLINGKYFPVNGKQFPVNGKHFPVKEKFGLISRKVFSLLAVFVFQKVVSGKQLFKLSYVQTFLCLFVIRKVGQRKTLSSQRKIWLGFQESVFLENLGGKYFPEVVKNLEMSLLAYYIKFDSQTFDCYIYFVLNIYFSISSLKI